MSKRDTDKPTVAFITTPRFRKRHRATLRDFVATELWDLCRICNVCSTRGTHTEVMKVVQGVRYGRGRMFAQIKKALPMRILSAADLRTQWKEPIKSSLKRVQGGYPGMIGITNEMIIGRVDAVIHLMDWDDVAAKPDTMVLRRQANVHDIPIACDIITVRAMVASWKARHDRGLRGTRVCRSGAQAVPQDVRETVNKLEKLKQGDNVIALIAHNGKKLDLCCFVVEHARQIVGYDAVLATGHTGGWIKRFLEASGRGSEEVAKVICCLSGPDGGDVQIAWMVVRQICNKVIFFQDPMVSHPHATDILLFEQALLYRKLKRNLATNRETAIALLEG